MKSPGSESVPQLQSAANPRQQEEVTKTNCKLMLS